MAHIEITNKLTRENIEDVISEYLDLLKNVPLSIEKDNHYDLFTYFKRDKGTFGRYDEVTFFEAANRIMTDFTILCTIKELFHNHEYNHLPYDCYTVDYGHDNTQSHDIIARYGVRCFYCEAFNVAPSFFKSKRRTAWKKLKQYHEHENIDIALAYNQSALKENPNYIPRLKKGEYHIVTDEKIFMERIFRELNPDYVRAN